VTKYWNKWLKLQSYNNWGHMTYSLVDPKDTQFELKPGDKLQVRWPSGEITDVEAKFKDVHQRISDHGHDYDITAQHLYFECRDKFRGVTYQFEDFDKVMVRRSSTQKA
jgi:hypothetical protein